MSRRLDRTTPPDTAPIVYTPLPPYSQHKLANGIPVYMVRYGTQEVVECQVVYHAGHSYESLPGLAGMTGRMLTEGTEKRNSLQLAQLLDDYGSYLNVESGYELTTVTLSTLARHLPFTLNLLKEVLIQSTIPDAEFQSEQQRALQRLAVEQTKTQHHARTLFPQKLFGEKHPYAYASTEAGLKALTAQACRDYLSTHLHPGHAYIIVAGLFEEKDTLKLLEDKLGSIPAPAPLDVRSMAETMVPQPAQPGLYTHALPGNVQSTLRIGHLGVPRSHPSYHGMRLVNTLLGGYFGSRLMSNIREEKGYTYGVSSNWVCLKHGGYFIIGTDVGNEFVADTRAQVKLELERLQQKPVPESELEVAKNYLLGRIVSQQETPFEIADIVKMLVHHGQQPEELEKGFRAIQNTTAADVQTLAQQHLHPEALIEVVAGQSEV